MATEADPVLLEVAFGSSALFAALLAAVVGVMFTVCVGWNFRRAARTRSEPAAG